MFSFLGVTAVLTAVLNALVHVLGMVAPAIGVLLGGIMQGLLWLWQNVFWKGLKDILEDWVTILTVGAMGLTLWSYMAFRSEVVEYRLERRIAKCETALGKKRKNDLDFVREEPTWQLPFKWPF